MKDFAKVTDLPMRYFVVLYGIYIIGRGINTFIDPDAALQIFTGEIQHAIYGFKFSYITGTILHPLIYSYLVVEFGRNTVPLLFSKTVIGLHLLSTLVAFYFSLDGSVGCVLSEFGAPHVLNCIGEYQYFSVILQSEFLSSLLSLILVLVIVIYSSRVISTNRLFFKDDEEAPPPRAE